MANRMCSSRWRHLAALIPLGGAVGLIIGLVFHDVVYGLLTGTGFGVGFGLLLTIRNPR